MSAGPQPPRPRRILVIEDHADAAEALRFLLASWGHEVEVARTGEDGIAAAEHSRPELVLCDLGLPDLDGHDVARRLRQTLPATTTRLVALSGGLAPGARARSQEAGFDAHLVKPASWRVLEEQLALLPAGA
ncbi:MAG: response regulator [Myxococcota bacterium]|nr:response regulator [Myxococcota bacterium]